MVYHANLKAPLETSTQSAPRADVHRSEYHKIMNGMSPIVLIDEP